MPVAEFAKNFDFTAEIMQMRFTIGHMPAAIRIETR